MLTEIQKKSAQAIVNIFETGAVLGDYGSVTVISGDTGHLTFGRSQTTLASGNLGNLLRRYCDHPDARFGARLVPHLKRFDAVDLTLDDDTQLHNVLRASADDPVMRQIQDIFFEQVYWLPAERAATQLGATTALGVAVVYDSAVHGSWKMMRDRTDRQTGPFATAGERAWISGYVDARARWLATHPRADLRATLYRMDAFRRLIDQQCWGLDLPFVVREAEISTATLNAVPPNCYDGPPPGSRVLNMQSPLVRGLDVRLLQLGLSDQGADIKADGVYGPTCNTRIKEFQTANALTATGIADIALIARLVGSS